MILSFTLEVERCRFSLMKNCEKSKHFNILVEFQIKLALQLIMHCVVLIKFLKNQNNKKILCQLSNLFQTHLKVLFHLHAWHYFPLYANYYGTSHLFNYNYNMVIISVYSGFSASCSCLVDDQKNNEAIFFVGLL